MSTTHNFPSTARILNVSIVELVLYCLLTSRQACTYNQSIGKLKTKVEMTNSRTLPSHDI